MRTYQREHYYEKRTEALKFSRTYIAELFGIARDFSCDVSRFHATDNPDLAVRPLRCVQIWDYFQESHRFLEEQCVHDSTQNMRQIPRGLVSFDEFSRGTTTTDHRNFPRKVSQGGSYLPSYVCRRDVTNVMSE